MEIPYLRLNAPAALAYNIINNVTCIFVTISNAISLFLLPLTFLSLWRNTSLEWLGFLLFDELESAAFPNVDIGGNNLQSN